ncbi:MAG: hypothetical protein ACRDK3_13890 [Actinomycetota bacterium]
MKAEVTRPWRPFGVALAVLAITTLAVFRLPDALMVQLQRNGPFTSAQAGWAFRLLAIAAALQAAFVGFVVLRTEKVQSSIDKDPKLSEMSKDQIAASLGRAAAGAALLTVLYGLSALFIGGQRAGFWLFVLLTLVQLAWYFRQTGAIAQWLEFQPEPTPHRIRDVWRKEPPDYCPPLARGLTGSEPR